MDVQNKECGAILKELKKNIDFANAIINSYIDDEEYERNVCIMRGLDDLEYTILNKKVRSLQYDSTKGWVKQYTDAQVEERLKRIEKGINAKFSDKVKGKIYLMIIGNSITFAVTKHLDKNGHIEREEISKEL